MSMQDSLKQRVLEAAKRRPVAVRESRAPQVLLATTAAVLGMLTVFLLWGGFEHERPPQIGVRLVGGTIAVALLATFLVLFPRQSMLPPPRMQLVSVLIGVPVTIGLWTLLWHTAYVDPSRGAAVRCLLLSLATAPWPFAALAYLRERVDPVHGWLTGAAMGAAAGAWSAVMVLLGCPSSGPEHVATGHLLPLVLLIALGSVVGARLFKLRRV